MPIVVIPAPPPEPSGDSQTPDGRMRATVMPMTAGVFLRANYTDLLADIGYEWPSPFEVTMYRQTPDGVTTVVRGAYRMQQYGGIFHAYDDEVTFGQLVTYWAEAPLKSGLDTVETGKVTVITWEPDGGFTSPGVWIKNLGNPDLSVPARCQSWNGGSYTSRNATADIWGAEAPAVVTDVRKSFNSSMTVLTKDEDEYQALRAAMDTSVVYIVGLERHRRRTGYYLIGDIAPTRVGRVESSYDSWSIGLTGMDRPAIPGQNLVVPGRSYADRARQYTTYQLVADTARLYGAGVEPY